MSTFHDGIKILRIDVHVVFGTISADNVPDLVLLFGRNDVFRSIHVRDLGFLQTSDEAFPSASFDVVRFTDIQAPYFARWLLENLYQTLDLIIPHSFVEILFSKGKKKIVRFC